MTTEPATLSLSTRMLPPMTRHLRPVALLALAAYIGCVILPNLLIARFGVIDVAPGPWTVMAPAAVLAVGLALVVRDVLHEAAGVRIVLAAIVAGTVLSFLVADARTALASGCAFLLAETLDLGVYSACRRRGWTVAALVSSAAGLVLDSLVFLWLAFGSLAFLPGQLLGKALAVLAGVAVGSVARPLWAPERAAERARAV